MLLDSFEESIHILQELADKNQRRVDKLEHVCQKQEKEHATRIRDLDSMYTVSPYMYVCRSIVCALMSVRYCRGGETHVFSVQRVG